jgi:hypothetical protein
MPPVARVESIRPGEVLESNLHEYPLPELLMGILRGNLTGVLEISISTARKNAVYFRDGVPIATMLPDAGVSLSLMLADRGMLDRETALQVERDALRRGESESRVIAMERLLEGGALSNGVRARARAQLVKLFDVGPRAFCFTEGAPIERDAEISVLQPLPIIYEGLLTARDRKIVDDFWSIHRRHRFRLGETYPRGVDPFEWGQELDRAMHLLEQPEPADVLIDQGFEEHVVATALTTLNAADMIEVLEPPPRPSRAPSDLRQTSRESLPHDQIRFAIGRRLDPLRGKSYYDLLRVSTSATAEQIERARRSIDKQLDLGDQDAALRPLRELIDEAARVVIDPKLGPRYRAAAERAQQDPRASDERMKLEVDAKLDRAIVALRSGRASEAEYLLGWIAELDPGRRDLVLYRALISFSASSPANREELARLLRPSMEHAAEHVGPSDRSRLCLAVIYAASGESKAARRVLAQAGHSGEPLTEWAKSLIGAD